MSSLDLFLRNAPVRDTFRPDPKKVDMNTLDSLIPKGRSGLQQHIYPSKNTLADDKKVFLYQKDRFVFQPSASLTQQFGNVPDGPFVQPSFGNKPTETFLRPPDGLPLTSKQRPLRNFTKEAGLFNLISGNLPDPQPREFTSIDTVTQRTIKDQVYSDGVPRQGAAMDFATEVHRNAPLKQGLDNLMQGFQNMPAAIAAQLAPLMPVAVPAGGAPVAVPAGGAPVAVPAGGAPVAPLPPPLPIVGAPKVITVTPEESKMFMELASDPELLQNFEQAYNRTKSFFRQEIDALEAKADPVNKRAKNLLSNLDKINFTEINSAIAAGGQDLSKLSRETIVGLKAFLQYEQERAMNRGLVPISIAAPKIQKPQPKQGNLMEELRQKQETRRITAETKAAETKAVEEKELPDDRVNRLIGKLVASEKLTEKNYREIAGYLNKTVVQVKAELLGADGRNDFFALAAMAQDMQAAKDRKIAQRLASQQGSSPSPSTATTTASVRQLMEFYDQMERVDNYMDRSARGGPVQLQNFAKLLSDSDLWRDFDAKTPADPEAAERFRKNLAAGFSEKFIAKPSSGTSGEIFKLVTTIMEPLSVGRKPKNSDINKLASFLNGKGII